MNLWKERIKDKIDDMIDKVIMLFMRGKLKTTKPSKEMIDYFVNCEFPDVDLHKWCEEHGLNTYTHKCTKCKHRVYTTIPFIIKGCMRGVVSHDCKKCGMSYGDFTFSTTTLSKTALGSWTLRACAGINSLV